MICKSCGKEFYGKEYPNRTCQSCYNYFRNGGIVYKKPPPGVIQKDGSGKVICHICGRSYVRLGSHAKESHGITIDEYKEIFGLCRRSKTTEDSYSYKMRSYSYEHNMPEMLIESGKNTRIKSGDVSMRKGKEIRLQEIENKKRRRRSNTTVK